ncbi:MAG TPA: carbohydrate binding family 9 domain-containing protein, partial [Gammaproteobacteria bacterium]|nr:carbohydrate binding family 9 domain-containing protein [Gammaproteobacteria bacterium]
MLRFPAALRSLSWIPCLLSMAARADDVPAPEAPPVIAANTVTGAVTMDGVLDEPDWQNAPATTLTQQNPRPGEATPYTTTVRVLRSERYIYFGITCRDPDPSRIAIHTLQRDADQSSDDNVMIVLDSFGQKKLAYVFQVNTGGARADGLISPGYNNPTSNTPTVDFSWNGYWDAAVRRSAEGWTAEVRISTQSLQFNGDNATWGLNVSRYVPRDLMTLAWSGITLDASATNLQWEGKLTGVQGLDQGSGFEFDPYAVTQYSDAKRDTAGWTGFDLKYNFTPALAGLFTYHTDFSEAPANALNVSASPYPQSIPETRAFFLDGANIFTFSHNLGQNFIPFYSHSIGLVNGATVPLDEGLKLLGHTDDWTLGVLDTRMADTEVTKGTNLFAGRASYNIDSQWRVGTLVTRGDPLGQTRNTLTSFDSTWSSSTFQGDKNLNLSGWGARSSGDGLPAGTRSGYGFDAELPNDLWYGDLSYNLFGAALDPGLGFIQRPGTKQLNLTVNWQPRPEADGDLSWIRQFVEGSTWYYVTGLDDRMQSNHWHINLVQFTTQSGWLWKLEPIVEDEVLAAPYPILPSVTFPAGRYHSTAYAVAVNSPSANSFAFDWFSQNGQLF